jgi:FkbM family methyltransferase
MSDVSGGSAMAFARWVRRFARRTVPAKALHAYRMVRHIHLAPFERELAILPRLVAKTDVAFDVGANVGLYSAVLSRCSRRVVAIEPNPGCAAYLRRLKLPRVDVVEAAAAETAGRATLVVPDIHHGLGKLATAPRAFEPGAPEMRYSVATISLDAVCAVRLACNERVGFIKIDVEGFELDVLRGAAVLLANHRPNLMVETEFRHGADVRAVFALLAGSGYAGFVLGKDGELEPIDADRLASLQAAACGAPARRPVNNVIFLPKAEHSA